eukprot:9894391-Alexandrium_andersonii.AAC.1
MSASLVGSEMCIRDSRSGVAIALERPREGKPNQSRRRKGQARPPRNWDRSTVCAPRTWMGGMHANRL